MAEKNLPFISVIVPFYNIEECVTYCLDSLVAQDYEGEYEILCVDDGSTDGTPAALDTYAAEHPRVKVLHKPNGGQSDARNFGVEHAGGDYITFVDGDDFVSACYLSSLMRALISEGADFVSGSCKKVNFSDVECSDWEAPSRAKAMAPVDFLRAICFFEISDAAWASLARRSLYTEHPFPVGKVYEDTYIIAEHVLGSKHLAFVDGPIYGYVCRDGSTVHPGSGPMAKCLQYFEALDHFRDTAGVCFSPESDEQVVYRAIGFSRLWRRLDSVDDFPEQARKRQQEIRKYVKDHMGQLSKCDRLSKGNKFRMALLAKAPALYRAAFAVYDKIFRGVA